MGSGWWMMDWPDAEQHFTAGVFRLTRIDAGEPRHLRLTDDRHLRLSLDLRHPDRLVGLERSPKPRVCASICCAAVIWWSTTCGARSSGNCFATPWQRVFPNKPIVDIAGLRRRDARGLRHRREGSHHHSRLAPSADGLWRHAQIVYPDGAVPAWRAIFDDQQRMVVAVNFNTDVADAWEFADVPYYPEKMTALAYRYGINYLVYAMTH